MQKLRKQLPKKFHADVGEVPKGLFVVVAWDNHHCDKLTDAMPKPSAEVEFRTAVFKTHANRIVQLIDSEYRACRYEFGTLNPQYPVRLLGSHPPATPITATPRP